MRQMIRKFVVLALAMAACLVGSTHGADPQKPIEKKQSVFLIGNSLTWDTEPKKLDGDVQWHVDCGKSLPYIHDHPGKPCVKSSKIWTKALKQKQYDILSIQPHYGTSLKKDVDTISKWMAMQPKAVIVIHTGWAHSKTQAKEFANKNISGDMQHSPVYFDALLAELKKKHPRREIRRTRAMDLLAKVAQDIQAGKAPFKDVKDLYRDPIHMKLDTGRYLMHNAMRYALGQPASSKGYEKIDPKLKAYLDATLAGLTVND